jgi:hypothetical protein
MDVMSASDWCIVIRGACRSGKTNACVKQAIERNATLVCVTEREAKRIMREYPGVKAVSISHDFRGRREQLVFDPDAFCEILLIQERDNRMKVVAAENAAIEHIWRMMGQAVETLRRAHQ